MDKLELRAVSLLNADSNDVAIPDFVEFYINDEPLSDKINEFLNPADKVLSKFTSVLGTMELTNFDRLKIRQLQGESINRADLEEFFPAAHFDQKPIFDELKLDKILVYCCAECGDYKCGGYFIRVAQTPDTVTWKLESDGKELSFTFSKREYSSELNSYLNELE
ncbi:MAG: hypothetical protein HYZ14_02290 [Bacteroidetes bacterium]|nr:hypothetical protein [Bacteroidota bacterium]